MGKIVKEKLMNFHYSLTNNISVKDPENLKTSFNICYQTTYTEDDKEDVLLCQIKDMVVIKTVADEDVELTADNINDYTTEVQLPETDWEIFFKQFVLKRVPFKLLKKTNCRRLKLTKTDFSHKLKETQPMFVDVYNKMLESQN